VESRKRLVWTGFEPFGENSYMPSGDVAAAAREASGEEYEADAETLAVEFDGVRDWVDRRLANEETIWAVHVGLAEDREAISLERVAFNEIGGRTDEAGARPDAGDGQLMSPGPGSLETDFPVEPLAALIAPQLTEEGLPSVEVSDDAGRYVCNALYYYSLRYNGRSAGTPNAESLFVHVPMMTPEEATRLGRILGESVARLAAMARMYSSS
jgi:pyroglutamyl-peptidase